MCIDSMTVRRENWLLPAVPTLHSDNWLRTSLLSMQRDSHVEVSVMTIEEAVKFLFVSQAHIRHLLNIGVLVEVEAKSSSGQVDIDATSIQAYLAKRNAAWRAYLDSQTEDNDPVGL
ncbi:MULTISPECIES: hypothetical protein [Paraburkholderia]|uniref:Helix-turn-helix domain-containing protein n=1 Tax=Paraburkholderia dioscoreae TaxID=2604047 RepID=A0A5Q4ZB98_9BURK|nr:MULTISPECIES: hypothetical protein [Paraburkholderia]MDR8397126.1 hypothetical protein [Paraburkholderia sp. USG1]VVD27485.1 conserved protein of unknown function [Paraburkholderia dioscoreae]